MADHPAWQELLNKIPESLHELVRPVFQEWDQGVQKALEAKTTELKKYEPYKQFVDNNIEPDWLAEAADFAYNFQTDPKAVIENANKVWNLGYNLDGTPASGQQQNDGNDPLFGEEDENMDITKHPQFAQLMQQVGQMQNSLQEFTSRDEQQRQLQEHEQFIKGMHEAHGDFDDNYVTALMANGSSFPQALEQYQNLIAGFVPKPDENNDQQQQQNNNQAGTDDNGAPVVMGANGTAGGGGQQQPISFGNMKESDLEESVLRILQAGQQEDANNS